MFDPSTLELDLRYLDELSRTPEFEALRGDLPVQLRPGMVIVDLDRFMAALRADCSAALVLRNGARASALDAAGKVAHSLVDALRDLMDARDSERAAREAMAEMEEQPA